MVKVGKNTWMPVDDLTEIEPEDGKDLVTTVNIDLQDIVENALMRGVSIPCCKIWDGNPHGSQNRSGESHC